MGTRQKKHLSAAAAALVIALQLVAAQDCGETNVRSRGAAGNGQNNDAWAFQAMENDGNAGIIYMSPGTYRLSQSLTLTKPIMAVDGAVFLASGSWTSLRLGATPAARGRRYGLQGWEAGLCCECPNMLTCCCC